MDQLDLLVARTQKQRIIDYLATGRTLTTLESIALFGCTALSQRITDLRREGHQIVTEMVRKGRKGWARYSLNMRSTSAS